MQGAGAFESHPGLSPSEAPTHKQARSRHSSHAQTTVCLLACLRLMQNVFLRCAKCVALMQNELCSMQTGTRSRVVGPLRTRSLGFRSRV
eukprot:1757858-Rhodomonas_salina.3